ncbi:hypothetical protein F5Y18DRAFT_85247 [Xylariaceae sp. FL1019]|nr:hypothetical protein F5Y18DRAFT_85247 [Xylariaceae sp. FL1019]
MRLLKIDSSGQLSITKDLVADQIPPYAILSHTWGADEDEVTFQDFNDLSMEKVRSKLGYRKLCFCRDMAREAGLQYFWVDTCCINRADHSELSEAIVSMFQWYANSERCFVYLSDVSAPRHMQSQAVSIWESSFCESRWLTRGWTLQELLAPKSVNFYSRENELLGNKNTLAECIHRATGIPQEALRGAHLPSFSVKERLQWAERRNTRKIEDKAYCLLGIFGVYMWLCYGEGENAWKRLQAAIGVSFSSPISSHTPSMLAKFLVPSHH